MTDGEVVAGPVPAPSRTEFLSVVARQRELSLLAIMVVLGALVALTAPQFLTASNLSQVAVLAAVIAVAAVGEALVVITRNVDLSVEATMGLVAYCVASLLERHALDTTGAMVFGLGLGLVLGMINGIVVAVFRVPAIVATLGTLSIFRGVDYLVAGSHQVPLAGLPEGFTDAARDSILGIPTFVLIATVIVVMGSWVLRFTRFGRQLYAVGSNPEAAAILGIPSRLVVFTAFSLCGLLAGVAWNPVRDGVRDDQRDLGNGSCPRRRCRGRRRRREHLRRLGDARRAPPSAHSSWASSRTPSSSSACRSSGSRRSTDW